MIAATHRKRVRGHFRKPIQHEEESPTGLSFELIPPDEVILRDPAIATKALREWAK
jgi:hypothetical protein